MTGPIEAALTLRRGAGLRVSAERLGLIEAVDELGSISAAARRAGLSYKGAWDAIQALNNLFETPLVAASPGGKTGGAAKVTPKGRELIAAFRRIDAELQASLGRIEAGELSFLWSLGMRTSAQNVLRGRVAAVTPGAVNAEVGLDLGGGVTLVAVVTQASVAELGLAAGVPAMALIPPGSIILAAGEGLKTSARNQIPGTVAARWDGPVSTEISLDIGEGKSLRVVLTRESAEALGLANGTRVTALVKAPHVILAVD